MRGPVRLVLLLDLLAVAAVVAAVVIAAGMPLAARGALRPAPLVVLALGAVSMGVLLGVTLLHRSVARPVDRILSAAARFGAREGELPILYPFGDGPSHGLPRAAVAFERLASALSDERGRLAAKVAELELANAELGAARESLLRSEKLATVGRLAAGVAHEVGNPLGAIGGYAALARERLAGAHGDSEVIDWLERIEGETRRIDGIVRELLDFARPAPLTLRAVKARAAVESALRLAQVQPRFRAVEVELALPADLPPVRGDEGRLAQLFLNLLMNAGDAMPEGGCVRISGRVGDGWIEVSVADEGPGIAESDLSRIFDPFFTTKPPGQGTGLGLAICHVIAESFGGVVRAENRAGGGAVLTLRLPIGAAT